MTQSMKALKSFALRGNRINPGDVFAVKPKDVLLLNAGKLAELVDEVETKAPAKRAYTRQNKVSASSTENVKPRTRVATNKAKPAGKTGAKVTTQKRRYNRRDMQAR